MSIQSTAYSPFTSRVRLVLDRLRRETAMGTPAAVAFTSLCDSLRIPTELRTQLLQLLLNAGYVTQEGDRVRLTAAGTRLVLPRPAVVRSSP